MNRVFLLVLMAMITISCHRNPLKIDVSGIDINLEIKRLDLELFKVTPDNLNVKIPELQKEYGKFFDAYNENIIGLGNPSDSLYPTYLNSFLTDSMRIQSVLKIDSVFKDLTVIRKKLEDGFKHYRYYFPQNTVPQIITILSGFNQSVALNNEAIGISLDNYLGPDCPFYSMLGVAQYKKENMHSGKIPFDVLYSWAISEFEFDESKTTLIANMIYYGKMLYFLDAMFPEEPDHLKIGYQPEKLEWCIRNEPGMWTYLIEHKLLFNSERMNIVRFIGAAPFTSTFTNESPGRTGIWLGWQIVRQYMKKNPNVTLPSLMLENDDQKILNESGYSPDF